MTNDDDKAAEGLTLYEALERYSDSADWQAFRRVQGRISELVPARQSIRYPLVGGTMPPDDVQLAIQQLHQERDRRWRDLKHAFAEKLLEGTLVAYGYTSPLQLTGGPVEIPADRWRFLRPNFRRSTAEGAGLKFIRVRMFVRETVERSSAAAPKDPVPIKRQRGRPSTMPKIKKELRRRGKAGELVVDNLSEQCRVMAAWNNERHPDYQYEWTSLYGPLRPIYNEFDRGKK